MFLNEPATTEIYTLSLHDALPISRHARRLAAAGLSLQRNCGPNVSRLRLAAVSPARSGAERRAERGVDRKSTRLNSSHLGISYAVFCLKKKKTTVRTVL